MATMTITKLKDTTIACGGSLDFNGSKGIYQVDITVGTGTGYTGVEYDANDLPDRFQIYYNGLLIKDSKYVRDGIRGNPPDYFGLVGTDVTIPIYQYNNTVFENTGETARVIVTQSDVADRSPEEPTAGRGILYFNKTEAFPATFTVVITGVRESTGWKLRRIICPQPTIPIIPK